ncbi:hypothetical protein GWD52_08575 [Enterobacteriaceae bacterium 4M9]|nr:hypothetical protein [Enterobacteriaceae bacterium 4M9]
MKKVMVFFNATPATIQTVSDDATTVQAHYPSGEMLEMKIMIARIPSLTGDHQAFYVAADRDISQDEIHSALSILH